MSASWCPALLAQEDMSTALLTTGQYSAQNKRVHQTDIPWFVWSKERAADTNVTGGVFAEIDAYPFSLRQTTFNDREVPSLWDGGEVNELMLTTSEFSRLGSAEQYLQWVSQESYAAGDLDNIIGGHINIAVQKPLEARPGLHVSAGGLYNTNASDVYDSDGIGGQAGISYAEQFMDDSFGVIFLSSYENFPVADKESNAWYAPDWDNNAGRALNAPNGFSGGTRGGSDAYLRNYLGLQWQPSTTFELNYDILYSTQDTETRERGYSIGSINRNSRVTAPPTPPNIEGSEVFSGTYNNTNIQAGSGSADYDEDAYLLSTGLGLKFIQGLWTNEIDLDYARSESDSTFTQVTTGNITPSSVTLPGDGSFRFDQDLLDLAGNLPAKLSVNEFSVSDELGALGANFNRILNAWLFDSIDFGVRGTDREMESANSTNRYLPSSLNPLGGAVEGAARMDGINYLIFDADSVMANNFAAQILDSSDQYGFKAGETTASAYAKLNFSRKFGSGFGLIGNVGLRAIAAETEASGSAIAWNPGLGAWDATPQSADNSYSELLPSLNLTLFPEWGDYAWTFSASRRIAKAPMEMLDPSSKTYDAWEGAFIEYVDFFGNPDLDPWDIYQFDLKFDWHFMDFSYISVGGSYKLLDTYIAQDVENVINGPFDMNSTVRPVNKSGGSIRSLSLQYNQRLAFIPSEWGTAGLFVSGVVTDSDAREKARNPIPNVGEPYAYSLRGLADVSTVSALWWAIGDWTYTLRHTYLSSYTMAYEDVKLATVEPSSEFALRIGYQPTERLSFMLEIQNLTNEEYSAYTDHDKRRPIKTTSWGQTYNLGLNYTF